MVRHRSLRVSIALAAVACAVSAVEAAAQSDPQAQTSPAPSTGAASSKAGLPEVVVEANRQALEQRVHTFVAKLTHSRRFPDSDRPTPRWQEPLCFEVAGLPRKFAEFVAARLVQVANSVGAEVRKQCSRRDANFLVVFSPNPAETLKYLNRHPSLLEDRPEQSTLPEIERFLNPPKPLVVRVWHNTETLGSDGTPCLVNAVGWLVCDAHPGGSRIIVSSGGALVRALILVDSTHIQGIQLGQLSDYVAMVGLVDVDDDVDVQDTQSILRLFTDPPEKRPEGLTEWDRDFLRALYHTDWRNVHQRMQIGDKMVNEIGR